MSDKKSDGAAVGSTELLEKRDPHADNSAIKVFMDELPKMSQAVYDRIASNDRITSGENRTGVSNEE